MEIRLTSRLILLLAGLVIVFTSNACGGLFNNGGDVNSDLRAALADNNIYALDIPRLHSQAKVNLGQSLFFDNLLSGNKNISCATCHHPSESTSDGRSLPIGEDGHGLGPDRTFGDDGRLIPRNSPEIFNRGATEWHTMFWDSRVSGNPIDGFTSPAMEQLPDRLESVLAVQAMFPVTSRDEMRGHPGELDVSGEPNEMAAFDDQDFTGMWEALMDRILAIDEYKVMFAAAYPDIPEDELGFEDAANAIAAFEAAAFAFEDTPFDRFINGDDNAMSEDAKLGGLIFYGKGNCSQCHTGSLLTDQEYHNIAIPQLGPGKGDSAPLDFGGFLTSGDAQDKFAFRTPSLRNVETTAPYFHDGCFMTLEEAVRHELNPLESCADYTGDELIDELKPTLASDPSVLEEMSMTLDPVKESPVNLTDEEISHLIAFLKSLTHPDSLTLADRVPGEVPSGLPLDE
ncbi:MAG TPA: cytochrome c peroxidase [bacterium]